MKDISKSINKVDNDVKMSGQADYVADLEMENMLYAMTKRSPIAKGKIIKIDYPELPENYYIIDHKDIQGKNIVKVIFDDWLVFTDKEVNYIGEPLMLVIGPNKEKIVDI
ncbi:MAG TPA: hypothetical protein VJ878_04190, partial [Candidatus Izemoplasmatales bacterium]|nr:hypothetical protein [Candidatus Izemoplasmatales bacterium]